MQIYQYYIPPIWQIITIIYTPIKSPPFSHAKLTLIHKIFSLAVHDAPLGLHTKDMKLLCQKLCNCTSSMPQLSKMIHIIYLSLLVKTISYIFCHSVVGECSER